MAVAQGSCPSCGAPVEYGLGASMAKVCEYCHATVARTDRGLENLGKVADIANTPSLIAVGDEGTLRGRPFRVFGRVQLDYGLGPWDEYYVAFDNGQRWGWLAFAEGRWYATEKVEGLDVPPHQSLRLEQDVRLGSHGVYRITEVRSARVVSAEGELPEAAPPGQARYYADANGLRWSFATLDYGDGQSRPEVFLGFAFGEPELQVTQLGPRSAQKVKITKLECPSCGGDIPKLSGDRVDRIGCPYCGALSEIATARIISRQELLRQQPDIPIGSQGLFRQDGYICIAYLRRSADFEGERYGWEEYLLWSHTQGYHWLVKDPETGWTWASNINIADINMQTMPNAAKFNGRHFRLRNQSRVRVDYVLGEIYWKCAVGELTRSADYVSGREVLSREEYPGEVKWSHSLPIPWTVLAQTFSLPVDGPGSRVPGGGDGFPELGGGASGSGPQVARAIGLLLFVMLACAFFAVSGTGAGGVVSSGYRGGGIYVGGK